MASKYQEYKQRLEALGLEYTQKVIELSREYITKNQAVIDEAQPFIDEWEREFKLLDGDSYTDFIIQVMDEYFSDSFRDEYKDTV